MTERKKAGADKPGQDEQVVAAQAVAVEKSSPQITCGLIMPIASNEVGTAEHWGQVRTIIEDALKSTGLNVRMVSESDEVNVIHHNIVTNIYSNDIVICDVSSRNPNVMFELGMRLTFDKPVVIIKDKETPFSFDVGNIQHLEYPRSLNYIEIQKFQEDLKIKTEATMAAAKTKGYSPFLSHYKIKHLSKIDTEEVGRDDFIISSLNEMKSSIKSMNNRMINERGHGVGVAWGVNESAIPYISSSHSPAVDAIVENVYSRIKHKHGSNLNEEQFLIAFNSEVNLRYPNLSPYLREAAFILVSQKMFGGISAT